MPFNSLKGRTFVKLCHSKVFETTAALLNELCHYGVTESVILSVVVKNLLLSFTNTKDWIHLNVGFGWWVRRYLPSLRVSGLRIFRYHSKTIEQWIESVTLNKLGKKQNQNFRIFEMQHSFYDPFFTIHSAMEEKYKMLNIKIKQINCDQRVLTFQCIMSQNGQTHFKWGSLFK